MIDAGRLAVLPIGGSENSGANDDLADDISTRNLFSRRAAVETEYRQPTFLVAVERSVMPFALSPFQVNLEIA